MVSGTTGGTLGAVNVYVAAAPVAVNDLYSIAFGAPHPYRPARGYSPTTPM